MRTSCSGLYNNTSSGTTYSNSGKCNTTNATNTTNTSTTTNMYNELR